MKLYEYIFKNSKNLKEQFENFKTQTKGRLKIQMNYQIKKITFDNLNDLKEYIYCEILEVGTTENDITMLISNHLKINKNKEDIKMVREIFKNCF